MKGIWVGWGIQEPRFNLYSLIKDCTSGESIGNMVLVSSPQGNVQGLMAVFP